MVYITLFNGLEIAMTIEHAADISLVSPEVYYRTLGKHPWAVYADLESWVTAHWGDYGNQSTPPDPQTADGELVWPQLPSS